ncbi:MAG: D-alanyl-D-alanine carboxypeptidase [Oscillospiraceae bacterium]|nr:D-alanyl-D-alanine carboxypeptidase [Oscillospiraceae bacterium]
MKIRRILSVFLLAVLLTVSFTPAAAAAQAPEVNARAALLVDTEKDIVLYGKNEHERMYPASITKVMTALLVLEAVERGELSLDQNVTASQEAIDNMDPEGSSAGIEKGEVMSVKNLLYCALMVSANEACDILAVELDGSIKAFVERMNQRAAELGCEDTHFANTNGLHHDDHYTTAWDIYLIAREAMKNETFMTICNTLAYDVPATNKNDSRELHTTNSLISNWRILGYLYDGAEGIKTGTTDEAGYCLLSSAVRSGRRLVCVVLGCEGQGTNIKTYTDSAKLYDYGFYNFSTKTILTEDEMICEVPVELSKETNYVVVHPSYSAETILPNDVDPATLERTVKLDQEVAFAPIVKGQILGTISLSYEGEVRATVPLLAQYDVSASKFLTAKYQVIQFLSRREVQLAIIAVVVLAVLIVLWWKLLRPRRRYGSRTGRRGRSRTYRGRRRR